MINYVYEFIGTFFLVFTVGMTVLTPGGIGPFAPLAIGTILAVMVYTGGHVSGGHYNPAVSLAVYLRGKLLKKELLTYWVAQILGALVASVATLFFKELSNEPMNFEIVPAFLGEFLFTFLLCFVVLNVATCRKIAGNSYFGWAIGFTVLVGAYVIGPISGGAFNPAVALGITIFNINTWANLLVYILANFLGAIAAGYLFVDEEKLDTYEQ